MRKLILCLAALFLASVSINPAKADLKDIVDKGVIRIGTQMDNPPFGYLDESGKPTSRMYLLPAQFSAHGLGEALSRGQLFTPALSR